MQPVILVVAVDGVGPQPVHRQLLLKKTDDLELGQVSAVAHIWTLQRGQGREDSECTAAFCRTAGLDNVSVLNWAQFDLSLFSISLKGQYV